MGAGATIRVQLTMGEKALRRGGVHVSARDEEGKRTACGAVTDETGAAVIHGVAGGEWIVEAPVMARPEGIVILPAAHVRVEAGAEKEVALACVAGVEVRGRLVDENDGKGIGTSVLLTRKETGRMVARVETNERGEFSVRLAPGETEARAPNWEKGSFKGAVETVAVADGMGEVVLKAHRRAGAVWEVDGMRTGSR